MFPIACIPESHSDSREQFRARSIFWYDFSEGSGGILSDKSSRLKNATITGATWAANGTGYCLQFDGNDKAEVASPAFPTSGLTKLTTIIKLKCIDQASVQWIANGLQSQANGTYTIIRETPGLLKYRYSDGLTATNSIYNDGFFAGRDGQYIYIVITADYEFPYTVKFYRNLEGVVKTGTMTTPVAPVGNRQLVLGAYIDNYYLNTGEICFFAVIPEILTLSEVNDLFFLL